VVEGGRAQPDGPTARQREVLELAAQGLRNDEIAAQLVITERTVRFHLARLFRMLDARTRGEMVHRARERGWLNG
jgi:DNA-binding CsgD family transcriptional regulator